MATETGTRTDKFTEKQQIDVRLIRGRPSALMRGLSAGTIPAAALYAASACSGVAIFRVDTKSRVGRVRPVCESLAVKMLTNYFT